MLNIITNSYVLPFITNPKLARIPLIHSGYKTHQKLALACFIQSLLSKNAKQKGGNCKSSRVLQSPVSSSQASPKVEASDRPKQTQHLSTCRKVQNGNTRVHQGLSDSRGLSVIDRPPKPKEVPDTVLRVNNKSGIVQTQTYLVFPFVGYEYHLD